MTTTKIDAIVDARPTCAVDLKVGDLVDGHGRCSERPPDRRRWCRHRRPTLDRWEDGQGRGPAGTYDDNHPFHLVTVEGDTWDDTHQDTDQPDEAAYLARYGTDQLMFSAEVFAALVASDWGRMADIDQVGDTIDVRMDGRHYVLDIREEQPACPASAADRRGGRQRPDPDPRLAVQRLLHPRLKDEPVLWTPWTRDPAGDPARDVDFYLGAHMPRWLERSPAPLMVSARTLAKYQRRGDAFPHAKVPWALDSGGFTELSMHGGWTIGREVRVAGRPPPRRNRHPPGVRRPPGLDVRAGDPGQDRPDGG